MSEMIEISVIKHRETDKAIQVSDDEDNKNAVWLPLSKINIITERETCRGCMMNVEVPEWLALEKGLI